MRKACADYENMNPMGPIDYRLGTFYAIATAILMAFQAPFSAFAARTLSSLDFMALTQLALLLSLPLLLWRADSRRDFVVILLDVRQWPKLAVVFLVGVAGLGLYDVGLSSAHPIITAGVLNLSPFWAALVAFAVSRRTISVSPAAFWPCFFVAFCGAMAIAWSQIDADNRLLSRDVIASLLHSRWIYALPMPAFFALSGTLVFKWFPDFDEPGSISGQFCCVVCGDPHSRRDDQRAFPPFVPPQRGIGRRNRALARWDACGIGRRAGPLSNGFDCDRKRQRLRDDVLPVDSGALVGDLLAALAVDSRACNSFPARCFSLARRS